MAYIIMNKNYATALCSKCGQEVKVNITAGLSNGVENWYNYHCQHCGHIGSIKDNAISPEHRTYSLDEILKMNQQNIKEYNLKRIADSLDEIKELLNELLERGK